MMRQFTFQLELAGPVKQHLNPGTIPAHSVEQAYGRMVDVLASFIFLVTSGHEQVGAVEAYVQDVSFCAFKWVPGALVGTRQTATAQTLLMSFTSTPMPKLLGSDWSFLFPAKRGGEIPGRTTPNEAFATFQQELLQFSNYCDA